MISVSQAENTGPYHHIVTFLIQRVLTSSQSSPYWSATRFGNDSLLALQRQENLSASFISC
jgi:hypothetical protein